MAIFNPEYFDGIQDTGHVTVLDVQAVLSTDYEPLNEYKSYSVPFVINFDATESIGTNAILSIEGSVPIQFTGERSTWIHNHRFTREGQYTVTLTVIGGERIERVTMIIEALPYEPEISDNTIIRALKIGAFHQEFVKIKVLEGEGDQV